MKPSPSIRMPRLGDLIPLLLALAALGRSAPAAPVPAEVPSLRFTDVTTRTGIQFRHTDGHSGQRYIMESVASGVATFDYDGDGDIDLYFLNGRPLFDGPAVEPRPRNALYRNDGGWRFTDVTEATGVGDPGYGLGVCVGDYDNDGDPDLYLNQFGTNVLYRNNGDGTFSDVTRQAGVGNGDHVGAGASFLDIDGDGDLDLFVANYVAFRRDLHQTRLINGHPAYVGPMHYGPVPATLFRNEGNGTFTDVSRESGISKQAGTGMGVVCADYDDDGDTDIIVGNDAMANFVWRNDGSGHFEEVGLLSGLAYDLHGVGQGTMGVECGDYDNDGRLDFHMTSYEKQWAILYRNLGGGQFQDVTHLTGAGAGTFNLVEWGNGLVDLDNDGDRDLFLVCGHLQDNVHEWDDTASFEQANKVYANDGKGRFTDVSLQSGDGLAVKQSSRGVAFDDLDQDGDLDVVILNARALPTLLRNDSNPSNHWIRIRLQGTRSNRQGVGARIRVVAGDQTWVDEVHSGRGYQSHFGSAPHFGLGKRTRIDRVEIRWPGGAVSVHESPGIDRVVTLREP